MNWIILIVNILSYIVFVYLGLSALYILIFAFAGRFGKLKSKDAKIDNFRKIAVLIPGYKEDQVIIEVAEEALKQDYPKDRFDVVIIADSFQPETISRLKLLPLILVEVVFEKSTKSKALNKAMEVIGDNYDIAVILDADNIMAVDFLKKVNASFENGFEIVQGHRVAKNQNTPMAVLDAVSEELNNHIFRKGHRVLGLSSALIGSGMAFNYLMFKKRMLEIHAIGGFDKELELTLLRDKKKIEYLEDAIVFDEKVQKADVFENQRRRWLSAQFIYFGRFAFSGLQHLILKGNLDFFDKVLQMISPPRIILLGVTGLLAFIFLIVNVIFGVPGWFQPEPGYWYLTFMIVVIAFLLGIPGSFYNKETLKAVLSLPGAFLVMIKSLFKLKGANKKFIHTQHGTINNK